MTLLPPDASLGRVIQAVNAIIRELNDEPVPAPEPTPFVNIVDDLPQHATERYHRRDLAMIDQIVIHHVGVNVEVTPRATAAYHVRKGWAGIGYHVFIRQDGTIYQTQHLETVSWHCAGSCNTRSVGICLEGSFMGNRTPPVAQLDATRSVVRWLLEHLDGDESWVYGHKELRQTACPGQTWNQWRNRVT